MRLCAGGAGQLGDGEKRLARQRRRRIDIAAAAIGQQERAVRRRGSWRCGRDRRAKQDRAGRQIATCRRVAAGVIAPSASPCAAHPRRGASGRGGTGRADAPRSTSSPPSPRSDRIAAMSAARWPAPCRRGIDHHAGEPRRQRQLPQLAALVGDAALRVDGAKLGEQRPRLGQRAAAAADRGRRACPDRSRPIAPDRAACPTDRRTGFPAAHRASSEAVCGSSHSR